MFTLLDLKDFLLDEYAGAELVVLCPRENYVSITFENEEEDNEPVGIKVYLFSSDDTRARQGCHIHNIDHDDEIDFLLRDAIESCLRDGFREIYVHNKGA